MSYDLDEDDEDDRDPYDDWWDDDDYGQPKEEPDCFSCNDMGCSSCSHHAHCDCAYCFEHAVAEYEIWDDPERPEPVYAGPYVDEPPF